MVMRTTTCSACIAKPLEPFVLWGDLTFGSIRGYVAPQGSLTVPVEAKSLQLNEVQKSNLVVLCDVSNSALAIRASGRCGSALFCAIDRCRCWRRTPS